MNESKSTIKPKTQSETKPKVNHVPVIIYSILAVILIAYIIYMYFAIRNIFWPFHVYILDTSKYPPDVVQPNGNVTYDATNDKVYVNGKEDDDALISDDERENIAIQAKNQQQINCNYYYGIQGGQKTFPIPKNQKVLGDCGLD